MDVGIGLPNAVPGTTGRQLGEWARRAEEAGFSTLGTIDRVTYPNLEPLIALAAAAAVTERIKLATTILIAPYRVNAALVAKAGGFGAADLERPHGARGCRWRTRGRLRGIRRRLRVARGRELRVDAGTDHGGLGRVGGPPPAPPPTTASALTSPASRRS